MFRANFSMTLMTKIRHGPGEVGPLRGTVPPIG